VNVRFQKLSLEQFRLDQFIVVGVVGVVDVVAVVAVVGVG
jgi:hypothetical protein